MLFILILWLHQLGHALDFNSHILYLPCAVFCVCPVTQLGCLASSVAATVAVFVIILQLYLVKTQAGPTPLRSSRAIKLPSCHIAYYKQVKRGGNLVNVIAIPHLAFFGAHPQSAAFSGSTR